jgi:hypothetical protein
MSQCKHVKETEKNYMQNEHIVNNSLENSITNIGSPDTSLSRDWGYEDKYGILPL